MGSKNRMPSNLRRPLPGPGMIRPDPFFPDPPLPFVDSLPPPEVMEQDVARQHIEMEKLALENERLAITHSGLRRALVAAQQELQRLDTHVATAKTEREKDMRILLDKLGKMEEDLQSFEPLKMELQQSRMEVENLVASRQELMSKVEQLSQDLEKARADGQKVPALLSELDGLRREYQNCRVTYDHERKLHNDHVESLKVMEKNYISMSRDAEKLRAELGRSSSAIHKADDAHASHNFYYNSYGSSQKLGQSGSSPYEGRSSGPTGAHVGYEAPRGPSQDTQQATNYDASMGPRFDDLRQSGHNPSKGATFDSNQSGSLDVNAYDAPRGATGYDASLVATAYDAQRGNFSSRKGAGGYDGTSSRDATGYEYGTYRNAAGYDHSRNAGYNNDPRGAARTKSLGYDASRSGGHVISGGAALQNVSGAPGAAAGYDDAPRGPTGRHQIYNMGSYGSTQDASYHKGVPYRGGNAQRE